MRYYKKVNKNNNMEMFYFLKKHFTYYTMSSWNKLESIANNVKLYNLGLNGDYGKLLEILEIDNCNCINSKIEDWECDNKNYKVGFNGRSSGYLVLYNKDNNNNVLDYYITDNDTYEDFKEDIKYNFGTLKNYHDRLVEQVEIVQSFDLLCDELKELCQYMLDNTKIVEEEITETKTRIVKNIEWK